MAIALPPSVAGSLNGSDMDQDGEPTNADLPPPSPAPDPPDTVG